MTLRQPRFVCFMLLCTGFPPHVGGESGIGILGKRWRFNPASGENQSECELCKLKNSRTGLLRIILHRGHAGHPTPRGENHENSNCLPYVISYVKYLASRVRPSTAERRQVYSDRIAYSVENTRIKKFTGAAKYIIAANKNGGSCAAAVTKSCIQEPSNHFPH